VKGLFFPTGPFSVIDVRSLFAACIVFLSFFLEPCLLHQEKGGTSEYLEGDKPPHAAD